MGYAVERKDIKMMCQAKEEENDVHGGGKQKTEFLVD
jgi:hypothetical protein